jgi:hypothetical protein
MKKVLLFILGAALTTLTYAQTTPKKAEESDLRSDVRAKSEENHAVSKDVTHLKLKDARADHRNVVTTKKVIRRRSAQLKSRGVKHPVARAKHQIHAQDEAKKYKD